MLKVKILGAGTPTPSPSRFGTSLVIPVDDDVLMFDCGPAATYKLAKAGYSPIDVSHLFLTHHHFDHTVDYPCFLLSRWDQGAGEEQPLRVFGPPPTVRTTEALIGRNGVYWPDIEARVMHPASHAVFEGRGGRMPRVPPRVEAHDIGFDAVIEGESWRVRTTGTIHVQPWLESVAYRLETSRGTVVFTGDTGPSAHVTELARDADVLLCMCWDRQHAMAPAEAEAMCGSEAAAEMARDAGVANLVLVHVSPSVDAAAGHDDLLGDVTKIYDGPTVVADEGMELTLDDGRLTATPGFDGRAVASSATQVRA